jgi:NO-binding membrane sensor protein with MHYT domain
MFWSIDPARCAAGGVDPSQLLAGENHYGITRWACSVMVVGARPLRLQEEVMSLILRIFLAIAGFITALFVARDSLKFDIMLVTGVLLVGSLWSLWRRQA